MTPKPVFSTTAHNASLGIYFGHQQSKDYQHFSQENFFFKWHLTGPGVLATCIMKCWIKGTSSFLPFQDSTVETGKEVGLLSPPYLNSLSPVTPTTSQLWLQRLRVRGEERDVRAGRKEGRKGRGTHGVEDRKREWGAKGSWLWRETSDLLLQIKDWDKKGLMPQVLRYHVIACHQLLLENLKSTPNATSLQGESIVISVSQVKDARKVPIFLGPSFFSSSLE